MYSLNEKRMCGVVSCGTSDMTLDKSISETGKYPIEFTEPIQVSGRMVTFGSFEKPNLGCLNIIWKPGDYMIIGSSYGRGVFDVVDEYVKKVELDIKKTEAAKTMTEILGYQMRIQAELLDEARYPLLLYKHLIAGHKRHFRGLVGSLVEVINKSEAGLS